MMQALACRSMSFRSARDVGGNETPVEHLGCREPAGHHPEQILQRPITGAGYQDSGIGEIRTATDRWNCSVSSSQN